MGLIGPIRAYYGGLLGILSGLAKSTDHPSSGVQHISILGLIWSVLGGRNSSLLPYG